MKVNASKVKHYSILAAKWLGITVGCIVFWYILTEFMWACYYAGIPM